MRWGASGEFAKVQNSDPFIEVSGCSHDTGVQLPTVTTADAQRLLGAAEDL